MKNMPQKKKKGAGTGEEEHTKQDIRRIQEGQIPFLSSRPIIPTPNLCQASTGCNE
jgi:hypothetical protein